MASVLDATAGGVSANTYLTLADAETYFGDRLHKDTWDDAGEDSKNAALLWATRLLDLENWVGNRHTYTQALRWPRSNVPNLDEDEYLDETTIPGFLEEATAELAFILLGSDITLTPSTDGISSIKVGTVKLDYEDMRDRPSQVPDNVKIIYRGYTYNQGYSIAVERS